MKLDDFLTMHKEYAIVITANEYRTIKDKICKFYTNRNIERIDDFCKTTSDNFLLCNPYLTARIITPVMLINAVTFVDRISFKNIEFEEEN